MNFWTRMPSWLRNRWGVALLVGVVYIGLYAWLIATHWLGLRDKDLVQDFAFLPLGLFAVGASWRVASNLTLSRYLRRAWMFLGLSCLALVLGDLSYLFIEEILELPAANSYVFDLFYLAFYPLAVTGLMLLPVAPLTIEGRWKFLIDLGVVTVAASMLIGYFVIAPLVDLYRHNDLITQILVAAFPIGDIVALSAAAALLLRRPEPATRAALWLFAIGLFGFISFDLVNVSSLANRDPNQWAHLLWLSAYLFFGLAALRQPYLRGTTLAERQAEWLSQTIPAIMPFVATALGYGLMIFAAVAPHSETRLAALLLGTALLTMLLLGRQMLAVRENHRLTRELLALSADLEKRVQKRAREVRQSHDALQASQNLASVGALATSILNHISQPLNTILTAGEVLEAQAENQSPNMQTMKDYVAVVNRAAAQAAQVMHALRVHARGTEPRLSFHPLAQIAQDALLLMGYTAANWDPVRLTMDVPEDLPSVLCDRNQMAQIFIGLLKNAREAMPAGGSVTVRARQTSAGIVIEFRDTGSGVPPGAVDQIFDPLYSTKTRPGLGLSVVSTLVRAHRGTVTVQNSDDGRGATFVVTLPLNLG